MKLHIFNRSIIATLIAAIAMIATSCSDDDEPAKTPLGLPSVRLVEATSSSLTFEWAPIEGAVQYGYKLCDSEGGEIDGGVTGYTKVEIGYLDILTEYTFHLYAFPTIENAAAAASDEVVITGTTTFYEPLNNSGVTTSAVTGTEYAAYITEERSQEENSFGTFTVWGFYGVEGYDLVFSLNPDNTINVLNGEIDEASGWIIVQTGANSVRVRNGLLIDPSRSYFDYASKQVYYYTKGTRGSNEGYEYYTWE